MALSTHFFFQPAVAAKPPDEENIEKLIEKFWVQEVSNISVYLTPEGEKVEKIFTDTIVVLANCQYQDDLPLIDSQAHASLGTTFFAAKNRFLTLKNKLTKNPALLTEYKKQLYEYIELGQAKIVPLELTNNFQENKYFVPHLCVLKEDSATTKVRVVFDFSCKTTSSLSLNDITLKSPQVQPELFDILCSRDVNNWRLKQKNQCFLFG